MDIYRVCAGQIRLGGSSGLHQRLEPKDYSTGSRELPPSWSRGVPHSVLVGGSWGWGGGAGEEKERSM